jgi:hypothetical protein
LREEHRLRVFENRELRIFGPERDEDGSWRKLHNDELHVLFSSPIFVWVFKARWWGGGAWCPARGRGEVFIGFWLGDPKGRDHWEDLGVSGRITLRWTLER